MFRWHWYLKEVWKQACLVYSTFIWGIDGDFYFILVFSYYQNVDALRRVIQNSVFMGLTKTLTHSQHLYVYDNDYWPRFLRENLFSSDIYMLKSDSILISCLSLGTIIWTSENILHDKLCLLEPLFWLNILFRCNGKIYFVPMAFIPLFEENLVNTCMHCLFFGNKINLNKF